MSSAPLMLEALASLDGLQVHGNAADLHHDLLVYLEYMGSRSVKRSVRDNHLPKNDLRELARRMSDPQAVESVKEDDGSAWISFVDFLAWNMKLVSFHSSSSYADGFLEDSPGERDNFVIVNERTARAFLARPALAQEAAIREALISMELRFFNEFYDGSPLTYMDRFYSWQRLSSTAGQGDYPGARRLLLLLLAQLPSGTWFSTAALVAYLKANHPYFLLPKKIQPGQRYAKHGRYAGFTETKSSGQWNHDSIQEEDADSFERVEGRFVEYFLESLPLLMRYVELAYDLNEYKGLHPMRHVVRGFRINDRFLHLITGKTPPVRVTVQPNFEVLVVSEIYPADVLAQLTPLGEVISNSTGQSGPSVQVIRLKKERVAAQVAANPGLDVVALLQKLSGQQLAQNVVTELREWTAHSETFTLYEGFGLLETADPLPPGAMSSLTVAEISPTLRVVRRPDEAFEELRKYPRRLGLMFTHHDHQLATMPDETQTIFATTSRSLMPKPKAQPVTLKREEKVILRVQGSRPAFEALRAALAELRVPVETQDREMVILYSKEYDAFLEQALQAIAGQFEVSLLK